MGSAAGVAIIGFLFSVAGAGLTDRIWNWYFGSAAGVAIIESLFGVAGAGLTGLFLGLRLLGPDIIKVFSCSTQLCMKFILLKNDKMPMILNLKFHLF